MATPLEFDEDILSLTGPREIAPLINKIVREGKKRGQVQTAKLLAFMPGMGKNLELAYLEDLEALADASTDDRLWEFYSRFQKYYGDPGLKETRDQHMIAISAAKNLDLVDEIDERSHVENWANNWDLKDHIRELRDPDGGSKYDHVPDLDWFVERYKDSLKSKLPSEIETAPEVLTEHYELDNAELTTFKDRQEVLDSIIYDVRKYSIRRPGRKLRYHRDKCYVLRYVREDEDNPSRVLRSYVFLDMYYERVGMITGGHGDTTHLKRQIGGKGGAMRRTMRKLKSFGEEG